MALRQRQRGRETLARGSAAPKFAAILTLLINARSAVIVSKPIECVFISPPPRKLRKETDAHVTTLEKELAVMRNMFHEPREESQLDSHGDVRSNSAATSNSQSLIRCGLLSQPLQFHSFLTVLLSRSFLPYWARQCCLSGKLESCSVSSWQIACPVLSHHDRTVFWRASGNEAHTTTSSSHSRQQCEGR